MNTPETQPPASSGAAHCSALRAGDEIVFTGSNGTSDLFTPGKKYTVTKSLPHGVAVDRGGANFRECFIFADDLRDSWSLPNDDYTAKLPYNMSNNEIADALSTSTELQIKWNDTRAMFVGERLPLAISKMITFAIETLNTMSRNEDWNADTIEEIRDIAVRLRLTATDESDGLFHSIFDN